MTSKELQEEIDRIRPPDVRDLVYMDTEVCDTRHRENKISAQWKGIREKIWATRKLIDAWREAHPVRTKLHDMGWSQKPLAELEQCKQRHEAEEKRLIPFVKEAEHKASKAHKNALERIQNEQVPTLAKIAEMEKLRIGRLSEERYQQELVRQENLTPPTPRKERRMKG
jgi:hypothetical protein